MNILIIDDEKIIRVPLADELREAGYKVQEFGNSRQALGAIQSKHVDVVIAEYKMPSMDGLELMSKIKSVKPEISVILITEYGSEDTVIQAIKGGAYDYIQKPFEMDEIVSLIKHIEHMKLNY